MLKGLGSLVARTLLLFLLSSPAWAANDTLFINSQAGDTVGGGQQATFTDSNGTFTAVPKSTNGITVTFKGSSAASTWTLILSAPTASTLAVGNYDNAQNPAFDPSLPNISVLPASGYCEYTAIGRFIVRAISTDGSGNITSFAADFVQTCGDATGSLTGAIRFNSTIPVAVDAPTADAGSHQIVTQGDTVTVDGSLSEPGNGTVTAYSWTQLSGPTVSFADASAVTTTFTAPSVSLGGADVVLQLEVDNSLALSSTSTVTIHVANPADPVTILKMNSTPGDYIGGGQTIDLDPAQAQFTAAQSNGGQSVGVSVNAGLSDYWDVGFTAPQGQQLQIGTYDGAGGSNYAQPSIPVISISGDGKGCAVTGRFTILDLQKDANGNITSFAADFEQICEINAPLYGQIRYNSTVPLDAPLADAGNAQIMLQGETVTLSGSTWAVGGDGNDITSYQWTQISGPTVTLSDSTAPAPTFTAPDVDAGGSDLVFQLTVTNSLGFSSISTVTVHVANPADAMTMLRIKLTPSSLQPGGELINITSSESPFVPTINTAGILMSIGSFGSASSWRVNFATPTAPPQQPLQVGAYNNTQVNLPSLNPSLSLYTFLLGNAGTLLSCPNSETETARFVILAIQTDGSGNLLSLAADFDESCNGSNTTLHGMLRYNSTVPLDAPEADAGGKQEASSGATVTLPGTMSYAGSDDEAIASYQWTQLSGPAVTLSDATAAAPSFTAPAVNPGGADLVFQLTVTNSNGITGTDTATVHTFNAADPRTLLHIDSAPGDPVGQGQTIDFNDLNAIFAAQKAAIGSDGELVSVTYSNNYPLGRWLMYFGAALNRPLSVGSYDMAQLYSDGLSPVPGLTVSSQYGNSSTGCSASTGYFDILDIQTDQSDNVTALAADFTLICAGATGGLHGQLRYNSAVPLNMPYADAGVAQDVDPGNVITIGGSSSDAGTDGATISSYQWVQVSGPTVSLSSTTGATASFTSPDVPLGGADLVFQLTITNSDGVSSTSTVTVHVANPNDVKTRLYIDSDPQDPIGQGQTYNLTPSTGVFALNPIASGTAAYNTMHITVNTGTENWSLYLTAPAGQNLQAGNDYQSSNASNISIEPGYNACDDFSGYFVVRDLQTAQSGTVTSFAADFVEHCNGEPPALVGFVRYNSTVPMDTPIAFAGFDQFTYSGLPVTLDGSDTRIGPGAPLSYNWSQIVAQGDPVITLSDPTVAKPMFLAPEVPAGGRKLAFKLTASNGNGQTDTSTVNVTVGNETDVKSAFYYESEPGDPVGQGGFGFGAAPGISVSTSPTGFGEVEVGTGVNTTGPSIGFWDLVLNNGLLVEKSMSPGIYVVGPGSVPSMAVTNDNVAPAASCPSPTGMFIVRDITYNQQYQVTSIGADFLQKCAGATGVLQGSIRYNSKTPVLINSPTAYAGPNQSVGQPGTVTMDGSNSFPGWGTITGYQWKQIKGTAVTLSGANTAQASFVAPQSFLNGTGTTLVFQLTVTNSLNLSSTTDLTITVVEPNVSSLTLQSDAGDPVGHGQTVTYALSNTNITMKELASYGVSAQLLVDGDWTLDFATSRTQTLQIAAYPTAYLYGQSFATVPELFVGTRTTQCKTVTGSFTVLDLQYGAAGKLDALAVDFVQHCNGIGPALHGKLRYHSTLP